MRNDPIAKLYHGLTNKERAALAFCYLTNTNELELDRLIAAVPRKAYVCPDAEYRTWFDRLFDMASFWAIEHWKAQAGYFQTLTVGDSMLGVEEGTEARVLMEAISHSESCLLALDCALVTVCAEHGFDPAAVRRLAGAEAFTATFDDVVADAQYQAAVECSLSRLLTARR